MKMLTKADMKALPSLRSTENQKDPVAVVKFFNPVGSWTWYATEFDAATGEFFGLVNGHEMELGYFTLAELQAYRGPLGLGIERDLHWTPTPLSKIRSGEVR